MAGEVVPSGCWYVAGWAVVGFSSVCRCDGVVEKGSTYESGETCGWEV